MFGIEWSNLTWILFARIELLVFIALLIAILFKNDRPRGPIFWSIVAMFLTLAWLAFLAIVAEPIDSTLSRMSQIAWMLSHVALLCSMVQVRVRIWHRGFRDRRAGKVV